MTDTALAECEKVAPFRHATTVVSCTAVLTLTPPSATYLFYADDTAMQYADSTAMEYA